MVDIIVMVLLMALVGAVILLGFALGQEFERVYRKLARLEAALSGLADQVDVIDSGMHAQEDDWR